MELLYVLGIILGVVVIFLRREVLSLEPKENSVPASESTPEPNARLSGQNLHSAFNAFGDTGGDLTTPLFEELDHILLSQDREDDLTRPIYTHGVHTDLFELDRQGDLSRPWTDSEEDNS